MNRICTICGGVDDHPRHIHAAGPGEVRVASDIAERALGNASPEDLGAVLTQLRDDSIVCAHMDCCADAGCPDGSCGEIAATVPGGKRLKGKALRAHLTSGKVDHIGAQLNEARATDVYDAEGNPQ